jgi:hypothetical protein
MIAYLPMALRRVYGGSRLKTAAKTIGLGVLYFAVFLMLGMPLVATAAMLTF